MMGTEDSTFNTMGNLSIPGAMRDDASDAHYANGHRTLGQEPGNTVSSQDPYRDVIAEIVRLAVMDCTTEPRDDSEHSSVSAYLWLTGSDECRWYCDLLGIEYLNLRDRVIERFYDQIAPKIERRRRYADAALQHWLEIGVEPRSVILDWRPRGPARRRRQPGVVVERVMVGA